MVFIPLAVESWTQYIIRSEVEWKIEYKVINKQMIVQILIVNTAFYIYGNIRLKEINILNSFEQIPVEELLKNRHICLWPFLVTFSFVFVFHLILQEQQLFCTAESYLPNTYIIF